MGNRATSGVIDEDRAAILAVQSADVLPLMTSVPPCWQTKQYITAPFGEVLQLLGVLNFLYGCFMGEFFVGKSPFSSQITAWACNIRNPYFESV